MNRKDILDYIIKSVESVADCKCTLTYSNKRDKYNPEHTYNTFMIKGVKHWKFGVWICDTDDKKSFKVYLFGEHEWYIDKFNPNATEISFEAFEVKKTIKRLPVPAVDSDGHNAPNSVWNLGWTASEIKTSSVSSLIKHYWNGHGRLSKWLPRQYWFYGIEQPLTEWYHDYGMIVPLTVSKFLYKLRFGKRVSVNIYSTREFYSPKWDFQVVYNTKDDDEIIDLYEKMNNKKTRPFLPRFLYGYYVEFINALDKNDRRGFYYR